MEVADHQRRLLALCAIGAEGVDWSLIARQAQTPRGLDALWDGQIHERSAAARRSLQALRTGIRAPGALFSRVDAELDAAAAVGAGLVTVLDQWYPANLRLVHNLPPYLFVRGELREADIRSVAVVGTRNASDAGRRRAALLSRLLVEREVTVVSGLARGIDTAAHRTALDAGGRTIAVFGTGIAKIYPAENRALAEEIVGRGALVSQFWPTQPPDRGTFSRRNVVTSGISQGTVVIEASSTSGAKLQARLALEHGKRVFLVRSLVAGERWAQGYVAERGAIEVREIDDVVRHLASPGQVRQQAERLRQLPFALA